MRGPWMVVVKIDGQRLPERLLPFYSVFITRPLGLPPQHRMPDHPQTVPHRLLLSPWTKSQVGNVQPELAAPTAFSLSGTVTLMA